MHDVCTKVCRPIAQCDHIKGTDFHLFTHTTPHSSGTSNLGDVSYDIHREFWGNVEMVGDSISVSGRVHGPIPSGNEYVDEQSVLESELGYFTL